jgi:hypothetical protein
MRTTSGILSAVLALAFLSGTGCGAPESRRDEPSAPQARSEPAERQSAGRSRPPPPSGRWRKRQAPAADAALTDEQRDEIERLQAIGYVAGSRPAPAASDVTRYDRSSAYAGLNLYTSGHAPEAILMDMEGTVLHRWRHEFEDAWPDHPLAPKPDTEFWRRVHLYENGDLLAIHEGLGILKLDKDSNLIWARPHPVHHDLEVMPDGTIYTLTRVAHMVPRVREGAPILEDFVSILDADGNETQRISLLECFENSADEHSWVRAARAFWEKETVRRLAANPGDIFHTNSIGVLDGRIADRVPAFARGNLLLSMCHLDMIAVVDPGRRQVVWSLAGRFALQHDPTITDDGRLMVFDNNWNRGRSSVTVTDPATLAVEWRYAGSPDRPFFSRTCGTAARLPNGNTLITESDNGRAFEVTSDGTIVWEFYNPHRAGDHDEYVATVFEMVRLGRDFPTGWLQDGPQR